MVCFIMKPMTPCGVTAPKNKFLRIPTAHRHHWRGYPYIIYKIASHSKYYRKRYKNFLSQLVATFLWRKPLFILRML